MSASSWRRARRCYSWTSRHPAARPGDGREWVVWARSSVCVCVAVGIAASALADMAEHFICQLARGPIALRCSVSVPYRGAYSWKAGRFLPSGQVRSRSPMFGGIWVQCDRHGADTGRSRHNSGNVCPNLGDRPRSANLARNRLGRILVDLHRSDEGSTKLGPRPLNIGQPLHGIGQNFPRIDSTWPGLGQTRLGLARNRQTSSADLGQHWFDFDQILPEFCQCRPSMARTLPNLAQSRPNPAHPGRRNDHHLGTHIEQCSVPRLELVQKHRNTLEQTSYLLVCLVDGQLPIIAGSTAVAETCPVEMVECHCPVLVMYHWCAGAVWLSYIVSLDVLVCVCVGAFIFITQHWVQQIMRSGDMAGLQSGSDGARLAGVPFVLMCLIPQCGCVFVCPLMLAEKKRWSDYNIASLCSTLRNYPHSGDAAFNSDGEPGASNRYARTCSIAP